MPKRRRLVLNEPNGNVVFAARGRLKGALMDALDPNTDDDSSNDEGKNRIVSYSTSVRRDLNSELLSGDRRSNKKSAYMYNKSNSYVMKLFDRSVDLAQFHEDTPLYPICRAWMANQPRNYVRSVSPEPIVPLEKLVTLPPPDKVSVPKAPPLLPEQCQYLKEDINFDYRIHTPPSLDMLLALHKQRWSAVRKKWQHQSALYESRYAKSQAMLKEMYNSA